MTRLLSALLVVLALLLGAGSSESRSARVYRVGGNIFAPVALSKPRLAIPEGATPGIVIFEAVINTQGRVEEVRVLRSTSKGSAKAIVAAVRQWRYMPAMLNGKPVPVYLTMVVHLCA